MIPWCMEDKDQATCRDRDEGTTQGTLAVLRDEEDEIDRGSFWEEEQTPD